jgi:hypothetical protein
LTEESLLMRYTVLEPPLTIKPLVRRHAEDAAFYWSQHANSLASPLMGVESLQRFSRLLGAHLDGLTVAGVDGWREAFDALEKWHQPGEAFVCMNLALHCDDPALQSHWMEALFKHAVQRPESHLRGMASALAWVGATPSVRAHILHWSSLGDSGFAQVLALRAAALLAGNMRAEGWARPLAANGHSTEFSQEGATLPNSGWVINLHAPLASYLHSKNPFVRAAACRTAALNLALEPCPATLGVLRQLARDADFAVRAEAAIALAQLSRWVADQPAEHSSPSLLWACVQQQLEVLRSATGWYRKLAFRRAVRWVRHLAYIVPHQQAHAHLMIRSLPAELALQFVTYHGDMAHLGLLLEVMQKPELVSLARLAGWAWQTLTGLDLQQNGLTLPEPEQGDDNLNEQAVGLPRPNAAGIAVMSGTLMAQPLPPARVLAGRRLDYTWALNVISSHRQGERAIAAMAFRYGCSNGAADPASSPAAASHVNRGSCSVRAPFDVQERWLATLWPDEQEIA